VSVPEEHVITALEPGRKRGRVTVVVDGEPVLDLTSAFAEQVGLSVGRSLSPATQDEIRRQAARQETRVSAVRMLGRQALTQAELRRRLLSRGLPEEAVAETLAWLAELGYLNDEEYAERRWESLRQRRMGTQGIVHTLRHEGVPGAVAEDLRSRQDDAAQDEALARELATQRNAHLQRVPWPQRRQRLYMFLARRGFDAETIHNALGALPSEDDSSEVSEEA
jgi:regulatory protein